MTFGHVIFNPTDFWSYIYALDNMPKITKKNLWQHLKKFK